MRIAIATLADRPPGFDDDERLVDLLRARGAEASLQVWDDRGVEWPAYDLVVVRSTWDYARRRDEFLAWVDAVGDRLLNPPALIRWNTDKTYLADLAAAGLPVAETTYVAPGGSLPPLRRESVVKPSISAAGRDTGRFAPEQHDEAAALVATIHASGRTAMVQPYLTSVDDRGETAIVLVDGERAHSLRKRAVLRPGEVAPVRDDRVGAAEVMYDPDLVRAAPATRTELAAARAVVAEVTRRFGEPPLYARVDSVHDDDGRPVLLELEAVEPALYLSEAPATAVRLADAIVARASRPR